MKGEDEERPSSDKDDSAGIAKAESLRRGCRGRQEKT
jgi:hypothetical protein